MQYYFVHPASGIARIYMGSGSSIASFRCPIPHASILPKRRILAFIGSASSTRRRWVNARKRNAAFSPRKSFLAGARGPRGTVDTYVLYYMSINLTLTSQEEDVVARTVEYTTKQGFPGTPTEIVRALMWGTLPKASQSGEASRVSKAPSSKPER